MEECNWKCFRFVIIITLTFKFNDEFKFSEEVKDPIKVFPDVSFHYMTDEERENRKLKFLETIDQNFKNSEKVVEELQQSSINKQKELYEKYNTN